MGLFRRSRDAPEKRSETLQDFIKGIDSDGFTSSSSGINIDELKAMQTSAVWHLTGL